MKYFGLLIGLSLGLAFAQPEPHDSSFQESLPYEVIEEIDEFKGTKLILTNFNILAPANMSQGLILADIYFYESDDYNSLELLVSYYAETPMLLEEGESLAFLIDGQRLILETNASVTREELDTGIGEFASYAVTPEIINMIGNAREVRMRLYGAERNLDRSFSSENIRRFRDFYDSYMYVEATPAAPRSAQNSPVPGESGSGGPPEEIMAIITSFCAREWPNDANVRSTCEQQQEQAVFGIANLLLDNGGLPADAFQLAFTSCVAEWADDFDMQLYCLEEQIEGYEAMSRGPWHPGLNISLKEQQTIQNLCRSDWPNDFSKQAYCQEEQSIGLAFIKTRPSSVSSSSWDAALSRCRDDWRGDYVMQAYCVGNTVE